MTPTAVATTSEVLKTTDIVGAATSLIPTLRSRSAEGDALARLPNSTIVDFEKARLFDMVVPRVYGGLQCSLRTFMDVVVELGRGDGSAAWTLALLAGGTWMAATLYPKHVVDEVFSGRNSRVAGVFAPRKVKTKRVDGGVLIEEGLWSFNSGVHHAEWDVLSFPIFDDSGQLIDTGAALIPISEVVLLNDWDTIGLRGSGSTSVAVQNVFVPNERIALLSKILKEDYASAHLRNEPLYRLPVISFHVTKLVFPALGMAKAALDLFLEKASHRGIPYTPYEKQNEAVITHLQAGEASAKIDAAELMLRRAVDELEASVAGDMRITVEQRARIRRDAGAASELIWQAVDQLAGASGGSFAYAGNLMNRLWRDVRVATLHGGIYTSFTNELFGRILCGQEPNTPVL
jgi:3-hydroxy-9,10-secoandrosta-1,3,5(10)-triene-9,17-dione monooxygenase